VPVDGFFEWKAIKGQKVKQPYAIAMKDGSPFGIGGIWENWKEAATGEWNQDFRDYHDGRQFTGGRHSRPHARRVDADVADIDAGQQAGER
jgi:SOS response associated peptidase (SRAP)